MPRYAPLPAVNIDPRNEAQLVNEAAKRVYDASNAKLNDFSAGNPLMALLEGQAFAQGEFLFWANQLPESILLEWIGPFLGAMRRIGSASSTRLDITIAPSDFQTTLPAGTTFTTNSNLTGGEAIQFVTSDDLYFVPYQTVGSIAVTSSLVGSFTNVPAGTITQSSSVDIQITSVANPVAAVGGSDIETLDVTKERFFTLIRRRNPVSSQDWRDLFEDLFGVGTFTSVLPNRSSKNNFIWLNDYVSANGHVSFFFLNPDGSEPTPDQVKRAQNVVDFSMPVEMEGHVYPIDLSQTQFEIDLSYSPTSDYAGQLQTFSLDVRDALYNILTPGSVFPSGYEPSVADVDSALVSEFPEATRYSEPDIVDARAYNTPLAVNVESVIATAPFPFVTQDDTFVVNDLLTAGDPSNLSTDSAWYVRESFTPYSSDKTEQLIAGNLILRPILQWNSQPTYNQGDVIRTPGSESSVLVVLRQFENLDDNPNVEPYILDGSLSSPKTFLPWVVGNTYFANNESTGFYDPDVVSMDQVYYTDSDRLCDQRFYSPSLVDYGPPEYGVGWFCFVVNQNFTLQPSTNTLAGAQTQGLISNSLIDVQILKSGGSYTAGSWIKTPAYGGGPTEAADPYYYYVDQFMGAVVRYAYVLNDFTFLPSAGQTLNDGFNELVAIGVIKPVTATDSGQVLSSYTYSPRFPPQTYLSFQTNANSDVEYYFTLKGFTPDSPDPARMVAEGKLARIDTNALSRERFIEQVAQDPATGRSKVCPPLKMFTYVPGNTALFRQENQVVGYIATKHFTPIFTPGVYINNGVLVLGSNLNADSVPFFDPDQRRNVEDIIVSDDGKSLYRVMDYFTPSTVAYNWDGVEVPNTARIEELSGNLLRIVNLYRCEEHILAPNGPDTSGIKLGVAQISLKSKNSDGKTSTFVWENTTYRSQVPALSFSTGSKEVFQPVQYGGGTLAL